ncbi:MAG: 50S ribosomal protein L17 [Nitrospirota bacterium]
MRHRSSGRQLGRNSSHRRALFRNLVTSLLRHERIETTEAKGKEIRAISDKMVSLSLEGSLASRRAVVSYLQDPKVAARLFSDVAPLFKSGKPQGGYTRLIKSRIRYGDGAPMVIVELTKRTSATPPPAEKAADSGKTEAATETKAEVAVKEKTKTAVTKPKAKEKTKAATETKSKSETKTATQAAVTSAKEKTTARPKQKPKEKVKKTPSDKT